MSNIKYRIVAVYHFERKQTTKTSFYLINVIGIKDTVIQEKMNTERVSLTIKPKHIDRKPEFDFSVDGNKGHISSFDITTKENGISIGTGDLGKDREYDILLFVSDNNFQDSFKIYHIASDETIKDTKEGYIVELFINGYFDIQIKSLDNQYYFGFMYSEAE